MKFQIVTFLLLHCLIFKNVFTPTNSSAQTNTQIKTLRMLVLSTMLADAGIGEWGFAALVEADGYRILFDTGLHPENCTQK